MGFLVYGSLNIDTTFRVSHILRPGETLVSSSKAVSSGGKGANQAVALARAGARVSLAGKIGTDGVWILPALEGYGVDTRLIDRSAEHTGQALIQLDDARQNCILLYGGGNDEIEPEDMDQSLAPFGSGDWLVCQNEISHVKELLEKARAKGMRICFNPAPFSDSVLSLGLDGIDLIVVNEIEGSQLAGRGGGACHEEILEDLVTSLPHSQIILTAGKSGALYGYQDIRHTEPAVDCAVIDTTGAGDAFLGYFLFCREQRRDDVEQAMRYACLASSRAVARPGAITSIPEGREVFR